MAKNFNYRIGYIPGTKCQIIEAGIGSFHSLDTFGYISSDATFVEACSLHAGALTPWTGVWEVRTVCIADEPYSVESKATNWENYMGRNPWVQRWELVGSKGAIWTVGQRRDGTWGCSCPAWKFAKSPKKDCKHIDVIQAATCNGDRFTSLGVKDFTNIAAFPAFQKKKVPEQVEVDADIFRIRRKIRLED